MTLLLPDFDVESISHLDFEIQCDVLQLLPQTPCPNVAQWSVLTKCNECTAPRWRLWCDKDLRYALEFAPWLCAKCNHPGAIMLVIGEPTPLKG